MSVKIIGTGRYCGDQCVSNEVLYKRISQFDTNRAKETLKKKGNHVDELSHAQLFDLWVKQVCGVEQRYYFSKNSIPSDHPFQYSTEYMGCEAAKKALQFAGIDSSSIEHVIFASYTPGQMMPNPACLSAHYVAQKNASALHINSACSSFLDGLILANMMIKSGEYKRIMVISADLMSEYMNYDDVTTAILFGDGACAAILEHDDQKDTGILSTASMTNYNRDMLSMEYGQNIKMQGGPLVQRNAVNAMYESLSKALSKTDYCENDLEYLLPHQANLRIILRLADKIKIPYSQVLQSVKFTGNVSGAAIGLGMDMIFRGEIPGMKLKSNDLLGLTTVGGGYTYSGLVYRFI